MAKLNGVKTLDMKDGVIERVQYEGAMYKRVEGNTRINRKVGDLFLNKYRHNDLTMDAFYMATKPNRFVTLLDDLDESFSDAFHDGFLFRKVEPAKPAFVTYHETGNPLTERLADVESRVDKLEGKGAFKAGDRVKVLAAGSFGGVDVGQIGVVDAELDSDGQYRVKGVNDHDYFYPSQLERVESAKVEPLKVGDYAKVTGHTRGTIISHHGFKEGEIVTILRKTSLDVPSFRVENYSGYNASVITGDLVKATEAEVAQAKADAVKAAKWAAIGRKVNEYRVGDVVVSTGGFIGGHAEGTYGEVVQTDDSDTPKVLATYGENAGKNLWSSVELITPVEARFDRK